MRGHVCPGVDATVWSVVRWCLLDPPAVWCCSLSLYSVDGFWHFFSFVTRHSLKNNFLSPVVPLTFWYCYRMNPCLSNVLQSFFFLFFFLMFRLSQIWPIGAFQTRFYFFLTFIFECLLVLQDNKILRNCYIQLLANECGT